jgi:hypothetical protein
MISSSLIPPDSEAPPRKPADIGETSNGHRTHAGHAMSKHSLMNSFTKDHLTGPGNGKQGAMLSNDDPAYDEYVDQVENMRNRNKGSSSMDIGKVLFHLGLPEYEYVDAQNYDYLLPTHLTYGKDQTVKLHNAKIMSCESRCCALSLPWWSLSLLLIVIVRLTLASSME